MKTKLKILRHYTLHILTHCLLVYSCFALQLSLEQGECCKGNASCWILFDFLSQIYIKQYHCKRSLWDFSYLLPGMFEDVYVDVTVLSKDSIVNYKSRVLEILNGFPCLDIVVWHAGCCEAGGKREKTRTVTRVFLALRKSSDIPTMIRSSSFSQCCSKFKFKAENSWRL